MVDSCSGLESVTGTLGKLLEASVLWPNNKCLILVKSRTLVINKLTGAARMQTSRYRNFLRCRLAVELLYIKALENLNFIDDRLIVNICLVLI